MKKTAVTLATIFACAAPMATEMPAMESITGSGTLIAPGQSPQRLDNNHYNFKIDVRQEYFFALRAATSSRLAILFSGDRSQDRQCPGMDIRNRDYHAVEIERDIFHVQTQATEQEGQLISKHGCLVIPMPDMKRIKFLNQKGPGE